MKNELTSAIVHAWYAGSFNPLSAIISSSIGASAAKNSVVKIFPSLPRIFLHILLRRAANFKTAAIFPDKNTDAFNAGIT